MNQKNKIIDLRMYRPASVLVVDLVKHSTRGKKVVHSIQKVMEEVFDNALQRLKIDEAYFNYTGDGYVCTLVGNSSVRILDFINSSFPILTRRFGPHNQQFRAGLDFGMVHLRRNSLTGAKEHFDLPGIRAARLEGVANSGQILCTNTVHNIFSHHYPEMFSEQPKIVKTKDRHISSYEVSPIDAEQVQRLFSDYLFKKIPMETTPEEQRKKILIVDDDPVILDVISEVLNKMLPGYEIVTAESGREALDIFQPGQFAMVLADIVMPGVDGIEITERFTTEDPDQIVVMMSGYYSEDQVRRFLSSGGFLSLQKPINFHDLKDIVGLAFTAGTPLSFRNKLQVICDEPTTFLFLLQEISQSLNSVLRQVNDPSDIAHGLLRHKAKHIVRDFLEYLKPGSDVTGFMTSASTQLRCIERLSRAVGRVKVDEFESHLKHLVDDVRRANPKIEFRLSCSFPKTSWEAIPFATSTVLIIYELIDNAINAVDGAGRIEIEVALLETTGMVNIVVSDTGGGIPAEMVDKVFEEGVSTKGQGRGLGLSLASEASRLLRGEITYDYHNGAVLRVVLFPFS